MRYTMGTKNGYYIDKRATIILQHEMLLNLDKANKVYNFELEEILNRINYDFDSYAKFYMPKISNLILSEKQNQSLEFMLNITKLTAMLDNLWSLKNGNIFVMDIDKALKLPNVTSIDDIDFERLADCYINFTVKDESGKNRYIPFYLDLLAEQSKISTKAHSDMQSYGVAIGRAGNNGIDYQFHFTKELFPRFIKLSEQEKCEGCRYKTPIDIKIGGMRELGNYPNCLIGRQQKENCYIFRHPINPQISMNILAYVAEMYNNRHTLVRKNSKLVNKYNTMTEIDIISNKKVDNKDIEVPLLTYARGEGVDYTPRIGTKHFNHSSPREHTRHEHTRTLKSGRIINIKQSTINKGKDKTIYKV